MTHPDHVLTPSGKPVWRNPLPARSEESRVKTAQRRAERRRRKGHVSEIAEPVTPSKKRGGPHAS